VQTLESFCKGIDNYECLEQGAQKNTSISEGRIELFKIPHNEKLRQYYYNNEMCESAMGMILTIIQHTRIYGTCYKSPKKSTTAKP